MIDAATALGVTCRMSGDRLSVWFVVVRRKDDESLEVIELNPWYATSGTDEGSQLTDVRHAIANAIDTQLLGPGDAVAVKRVEMPPGRPPKHYDRKIHFEASAMLAADAAGIR